MVGYTGAMSIFQPLFFPAISLISLTVLMVIVTIAKVLIRENERLSFRVEANRYFFSKAENRFYSALIPIADDLEVVIFPKVGLNDIFRGKQGARPGQYNRYAHMHVDYLLVTKADFRPIAGIELDGSSHESDRQKERDTRKNAVFKAAGLPLVRFRNEDKNSDREVRQKIENALGERKKVRA